MQVYDVMVQYNQGPDMGKCRPGASRKVPPPSQSKSAAPTPKPQVKAKSSLSGRNYFITVHHQAGFNFENSTEVKFQDILLAGKGNRDRGLNRDVW